MRIRELRKAQGLTQQDVANHLNIERASYARYESGSREPDVAILIALADLFQVSLDYLCERTDTPYYISPLPENGLVFSTKKEAPLPKDEALPHIAKTSIKESDLPKDRKELEQFVLDLLRKNH